MPGRGIHRRQFIAALGATLCAPSLLARQNPATGRPNILCIVSEDNNPYLGSYGDKLARTPNIDRLAREGVLYENSFSQAPVCAPSRFTLITGMYATSCGPANHMRASGKPPDSPMRGFTAYLRDSGYYCSNNAKTDYNAPIDMKATWDESSRQAHYRKRRPGQPFFAVFNHEVTHESSIHGRREPLPGGTDPAAVRIPAYCPDTPETRRDRALYYDNMARLDEQVGRLLRQLEDDGLAEDTIVFYYGDNGGVLPRSKRFCYDSGLRVPLIVRFPRKWRHLAPGAPGTRIDAPVSQVDYAPTMLSLAGIQDMPAHFQGHAFLGPKNAGPGEFAFCFRDRMDERYDMVRTARDKRYRYIRNYMPHLPWGQHVQYLWQQQGIKVWERLYKEGKLSAVQRRFWEEKPAEELYDLRSDPDEVNNLAASPEHRQVLERMRAALRKHLLDTRDNGFIPEGSPLEGYPNTRDAVAYPLDRVVQVADLATERDPKHRAVLATSMSYPNECVRYWAAMGLLMLRDKGTVARELLLDGITDDSPQVRVVCAEALCHTGAAEKGLPVLVKLLTGHDNVRVRLQAINALGRLSDKAKPALAVIDKARQDNDDYVKRVARYTTAVLKNEEPPGEEPQ